METEGVAETNILSKRVSISTSNLVQVAILIFMAILAFAYILLPNSGDGPIITAYNIATSVCFSLLVLIGSYEVKHQQGSFLEIALYLVVGVILRNLPDAVITWPKETALLLLGFYMIMIVWNLLGGRYGIWHAIRNSLRRSTSDSTDHSHPQEDEEIVAVEADEDEDDEEDEPETG